MTTKQIQHLLAYLGYYVGMVDGIWGDLSKEACKAFQSDSDLTVDGIAGKKTQQALKQAVSCGNQTDALTESFWKEIEYFQRKEFRCPCGTCGGFPVEPEEKLVRIADQMRRDFDCAVIIVPPEGHGGGSGVRCQAYNDSLSGSVKNSRHVQGKAVDFQAPGKSDPAVENYLAKLHSTGTIRYWYRICSGSWHMDIW